MPNQRNRKKPNKAAFTRSADAAVYLHVTRNTVVQEVLASERQRRAHAWSHNDARRSQQPLRERPALKLRTGMLASVLRERQTHEQFELAERRRRNGYLPSRENSQVQHSDVPIVRHAPGWILKYGQRDQDEKDDWKVSSKVPRLQNLALTVFNDYFEEYHDAMGKESLHSAMALLPPETLAELSILVSSKKHGGINDHTAILLAKHGHVDQLCLRAAALSDEEEAELIHDNNSAGAAAHSARLSSKTLTDQGLLELIPQLTIHPSKDDKCDKGGGGVDSVPECWEDDDGENDNELDPWAIQALSSTNASLNIKLRRLELLDCQHITAAVLLKLFERCSGITHLSLAGSFSRNPQDGMDVVSALPSVLPNLEVLDVTRCPWAVHSQLKEVMRGYKNHRQGNDYPPPIFHCQGTNHGMIDTQGW